jgi:hypothetical protein
MNPQPNLFIQPIALAVACRPQGLCVICRGIVPQGLQLVKICDPPGAVCVNCGRTVDPEATAAIEAMWRNEAKRQKGMPV